MKLFRTEVETELGRSFDIPMFGNTRGDWPAISGLLLVFIGFSGWAIYGSFPRTQYSQGYLSLGRNEVKLVAPKSGVFEGPRVKIGQHVERQAVIAAIIDQQLDHSGIRSKVSTTDILNKRLMFLRRKKLLIESNNGFLTENAAGDRSRLIARIRQLEAQAETQMGIVLEAQETLKALQPLLEKGFESKLDYSQRRRTLILEQQQLEKIRADIADERSRLDDAGRAVSAARLKTLSDSYDAMLSAEEVKGQIAQIEESSRSTVRSPISGRIIDVYSGNGRFVKAGDSLGVVAPEGSLWSAFLFIPSRGIGALKLGQKVWIEVAPYPTDRYGYLEGTVKEISEAAQPPEQTEFVDKPQEQVFRVEVRLAKGGRTSNGSDIRLRVGLKVMARIILAERSFFGWLSESVRTGGRS